MFSVKTCSWRKELILMINRVILVGRLTRDPELRYTPNGVAVATFSLAVNRAFANQQGEREADFINCVVWRKQAENVANFLKKGSLAGVDGRIQTRNYEGQDGKRVYVTEVVAESVQFLEPKGSSSGGRGDYGASFGGAPQAPSFGNSPQNQPQSPNRNNQGHTRLDEDPFANDGQIDISDDDLPF
jgi:single-strand DNA-binding protein